MGQLTGVEFINRAPSGLVGELVGDMTGYLMNGAEASLHRGAPSPYLTLIINLDDPIVIGTHAGSQQEGSARSYDNIIGGLHTHAAYLFQPPRQAGIQLMLHPLAARRLLGAPAATLRDIGTEASSVLGESLVRMRDAIGEATSWPRRFDILDSYLRTRLGAAPPDPGPRPEVVAAWQWMTRLGGQGRMSDLARHVALSPRQLAKAFHAEVGLPPKMINRLIRFDAVSRRLRHHTAAAQNHQLHTLAQDAGYFDQAHLARDFRDFLGCSPSQWIAEEGEFFQARDSADDAALLL